MKLHTIPSDEMRKLGLDPNWATAARPSKDEKKAAVDGWMRVDVGLPGPSLSPEQRAALQFDPNTVEFTGGRRNSGVYQGQLIARQREALAAWKETDNYKDAYLKKKKRRRRRPEWIPQSREYQFEAIMKHTEPEMLGKPEPPPKTPDPYRSSEYKQETKKDPGIPLPEGQKDAYKSLEYQKAYPVPPIAYPGVPLGNNPSEGPWIEVFDSMWTSSWVTLKDLDLGEAAKREEFMGYDLNSDKIA